MQDELTSTKDRLLLAAEELFVFKGYAETSVEDICSAVGATKGAFFHHFENKEAIGMAALEHFAHGRLSQMCAGEAHWPEDPAERLFAFVEDVSRVSSGRKAPKGCLVALLAMELGAAHAGFRQQCALYFSIWQQQVRSLLAAALIHRTGTDTGADELAEHFLVVFEGSMILTRARQDPAVFERSLGLYRQHLERALGRRAGAPPAPRPELKARRSSRRTSN